MVSPASCGDQCLVVDMTSLCLVRADYSSSCSSGLTTKKVPHITYIYGDPAYQISPWLMAPFKGALTAEEEDFNAAMSSCRVT
ncbi:unnamed protein product, partial [Laminaria digitata]